MMWLNATLRQQGFETNFDLRQLFLDPSFKRATAYPSPELNCSICETEESRILFDNSYLTA